MLERFTWFRQSAMRFVGDGITVYIDPWGTTEEDSPADVILITHAHADHFQPQEIERLSEAGTKLVAPHDVARELSGDVAAVAPGDSIEVSGIRVQAVPAYNVHPERLNNHPKANRWVGYILELDGKDYYHAGDTDHAPELDDVKTDVAFLPIGGTYTMEPAEAAGLARSISPQIAVPMHYGFVVGSPKDAETFRREAEPVTVEVLTPVNPFERD
ncbi:MAG TPA: MBL fold metallo-hydrolase [Actinomycetota bacterium]|nr:MBL fold metallo-hydrolase [Actinomycetota bacterium]